MNLKIKERNNPNYFHFRKDKEPKMIVRHVKHTDRLIESSELYGINKKRYMKGGYRLSERHEDFQGQPIKQPNSFCLQCFRSSSDLHWDVRDNKCPFCKCKLTTAGFTARVPRNTSSKKKWMKFIKRFFLDKEVEPSIIGCNYKQKKVPKCRRLNT